MKKWLKRTVWAFCAVAAALVVCVLGYLAYLFLSYERIPDNVVTEVKNTAQSSGNTAKAGAEYMAITYNIGFGAYSDDYSFFMDGGEYSRAYSPEAVTENVSGAIGVVTEYNGTKPDILLLQEVDVDATRSYHIDEYEIIQGQFAEYASNFALNYHSEYLLYPLTSPHGATDAGLATLSRLEQSSALRRQLPVSTGISKFFDLDRAYVITRVPVDNGRELSIYNVHLSAYTTDITIVSRQIEMIREDMENDLAKGNYIVCGGDFNQDMLGNSPEVFGTEELSANWASPFPTGLLPDGVANAYDLLSSDMHDSRAPSCRNADAPYVEGESFVTVVDGFLISDNVELLCIETVDTGFRYSDHNPVVMRFRLKE